MHSSAARQYLISLSEDVLRGRFPPYQFLIESYTKAQEVVTRHEVLA